ncbi:MAG: hypothetical protein ACRCTE_00195, partial [Cellulosilyticaceae bacterium]
TLILLPLQKDVPFDSSFCIPQLFSLLSALYYLNISFGYLFEIGPSSVSTFLALRLECDYKNILDSIILALKPLYPTITPIFPPRIPLLNQEIGGVTSVTFIPSSKQSSPSVLPTLMSNLAGLTYSILFLSEPVDSCIYLKKRRQLWDLYSEMLPLREQNHSYTDTDSSTKSKNGSKSDSHTNTKTSTDTNNCSNSSTTSEVTSSNFNVSPKLCEKATLSQNRSTSATGTQTNNASDSTSNTCTTQEVCSSSLGDSDSCTTTHSHTHGTRQFNRSIDRQLTRIDALMDVIDQNVSVPVFNFSAYFLAPCIATSVTAASTYTSLIQPTLSLTGSLYTNLWHNDCYCIPTLQKYLSTLHHPVFCPCQSYDAVTPTLIINQYSLNSLLFACN